MGCKCYTPAILLFIGLLHFTGVKSIGVCYGINTRNIPSPRDVITLYKNNGIKGLRIYDAYPDILDAVRGSKIDVILDVPNETLQELNDPSLAKEWVQNNIVRYTDVNFKYIAVGNEVFKGNPLSRKYIKQVLPALRNVHDALSAIGLQGRIKASTATYSAVLSNAYPPMYVNFNHEARGMMVPIVQYLKQIGSPLLANIYPYFARVQDKASNSLSYSLFNDTTPNDAGYSNLFDAMLDSMHAAVEKVVGSSEGVEVVVSESGWPSDGGFDASLENAGMYYKNLISHIKGNYGTPMMPGISIETYLYAIFDEDLQRGDNEIEKHFGLFNPNDQSPKYQLSFIS